MDGLLFPTLDICTIDLPKNQKLQNLTSDACNLRKLHEHDAKLTDRERTLIATSLDPSSVHIRHQRQHLATQKNISPNETDLRSKITNTRIVMTKDEFRQRYNLTDVKR